MKIQQKCYVVAYCCERGKSKGKITLTAITGSTKKDCAANFKLQTDMTIVERAERYSRYFARRFNNEHE